jgi:LysR family nitrogen assimilation transcriptional regulator
MNTKHIQSFLRVVQCGSISQAAIAMGLSQPVLSRHIQELEAALQARLLHRDGHGVSLTDAGQQILPRLEQILEHAALAETEAALWAGTKLTRATIAMPPTLIRMLAAPLTAAILSEAPEAQLHLVEAFSGTLAEWLAEGRIDLAILYVSGVSPRVQAEPLLTERLHLIVDANRPAPNEIAFAALAQQRLILPSKAHGLRRTIDAVAASRALVLPVQLEADSFAAIIELVAGGFGSTILPAAAIRAEIRAGTLNAIPITDPMVERALCMATARNRAIPPGTSRLLPIIRTLIRTMDRDYAWSGGA